MKSVDYLGQEGEATEFQIFLKRGLEKNRTWIIFFLKVLHPPQLAQKMHFAVVHAGESGCCGHCCSQGFPESSPK